MTYPGEGDEPFVAHPVFQHPNGDKCIWVDNSWFVPYDASGGGVDCDHEHPSLTDEASYKEGIVDFVNKVSADYHKHNGVAVQEDVLIALAYFGIDPAEFYNDAHERRVAMARAELYKLTGEV